ncbi:MAG: insulinase family protein [Nitrospirota bacterium]|nr:insulinase family protein [Nitrospirota bacterium]
MLCNRLVTLLISTLLAALLLPAEARAAKVRSHTLENGLKVVLVEEHKAPVVTFQVWYPVGSRNEVVGLTGLSHLLEHLMFKGTPTVGKGEYARMVSARGGSENAMTSRDYTAYYMTWAPEYLPLSAELEADRMRNLVLDDTEFDLERNVVREERRMRIDDNPIMSTVEQMYATAFMAHPYGQPVIGWMSDLEHLTAEDARRHYRTYYAPDNAVVVVAGDFDPKTALAEVRRQFGPIPAGGGVRAVHTVEPEQKGERRLVLKRQAQLPFLFMGYHAPNWQSEDAHALVVLAQILFEGKRSRMYQRLVFGDRIAVDEGGEYDPVTTDPELFYIYAVASPDADPATVEAAIHEEVARIQATPPEARELERAKNQIEAGYLLAQDSMFYQAMQYGTAEATGAGSGYVDDFPKQVRRVTAEDVSRVARSWLTPENRTVALMQPITADEVSQ